MPVFVFRTFHPTTCMDFSDFFRNAVPLATVAGVAFAIVNQAFRWTWRLAQVEQKSNENADEISRVEEESVPQRENGRADGVPAAHRGHGKSIDRGSAE